MCYYLNLELRNILTVNRNFNFWMLEDLYETTEKAPKQKLIDDYVSPERGRNLRSTWFPLQRLQPIVRLQQACNMSNPWHMRFQRSIPCLVARSCMHQNMCHTSYRSRQYHHRGNHSSSYRNWSRSHGAPRQDSHWLRWRIARRTDRHRERRRIDRVGKVCHCCRCTRCPPPWGWTWTSLRRGWVWFRRGHRNWSRWCQGKWLSGWRRYC